MANDPIVAPADQVQTPPASSWWNGWKSILGVLMIAGGAAMEVYGIPAGGTLRDAGLAMLGLGLASRTSRILTAVGGK